MVLSLPPPLTLPLRSLSERSLAATRLAGDEVSSAGEEVLLRGFVGRGSGEKLEGLEIVRLHHGVMRGGGATTGEEQDREEQRQLGDERSQVANDGVRRGIIDELLTAIHQDERQEDREGEEHPAHEAVALGGAMEDFGSGGRRGAGHSGGKEQEERDKGKSLSVGPGPGLELGLVENPAQNGGGVSIAVWADVILLTLAPALAPALSSSPYPCIPDPDSFVVPRGHETPAPRL